MSQYKYKCYNCGRIFKRKVTKCPTCKSNQIQNINSCNQSDCNNSDCSDKKCKCKDKFVCGRCGCLWSDKNATTCPFCGHNKKEKLKCACDSEKNKKDNCGGGSGGCKK